MTAEQRAYVRAEIDRRAREGQRTRDAAQADAYDRLWLAVKQKRDRLESLKRLTGIPVPS